MAGKEKDFTITDDGIRLHARLTMPETEGKCPLVIVVHGYSGDMEEDHIAGLVGLGIFIPRFFSCLAS